MWNPTFWCLVAVSLSAFGLGFLALLSPAVKRALFKAPIWVRHPIYVGNTLSVLGMALVFRAAGALVYVLVLVALFLAGIPIEERDLRAAYGDEYSAYEKKVRYRLIPRVF